MRALVIGADGFVGPYLISELLKSGYDVIGTYLKSKPGLNITLRKLDILNKIELTKTINELNPDVIFNLAAISSVKMSFDMPDMTMQVNYEGTKNILDFAKKSKIILIGSAEEYGNPLSIPIKEEHLLNPKNPYGKSKKIAEEAGIQTSKEGGKVIILRSFNHIGAGQTTDFAVSSFAKQISDIEKGKSDCIKVGNLDAIRDFTDVRDIAIAYVLASEKCKYGVPYNICSGKGYRISDLLGKLCKMSLSNIKIEQDPDRMRPSDIPVFVGDNSRFSKLSGWEPKISIDDSLKTILDYWRAR
ncbi:MAG: GDP-mannose 4,6-dehydratase [archaeon]